MRFSEQYKREAIALYEENTMAEVFQQLAKRFPNKHHPNEKTIRRWRDDPERQANQAAGLTETERKAPRERLITNDALYEKIIDFPPWAKNPQK